MKESFLIVLDMIHVVHEVLEILLKIDIIAMNEDVEEDIRFFLKIRCDELARDFREIEVFNRLSLEIRGFEAVLLDVGLVPQTVEHDDLLDELETLRWVVLHQLLTKLHDEVLLLLQLDLQLDVVYRFQRLEVLPFFLHLQQDLQVLLVLVLLLR